MTESEIKTNILQAKDQMKQIPICAQVNACSVDKIKEILKKQGVDLRALKGERPNRMKNHKKKMVQVSVTDNDKTFLELFNRVNELTAQREAINAELLTIKAELVKIMSAIDKGVDNGETNGQ
jgi:hypothetical protein